MEREKSLAYNLYSTEKIYNDYTLFSYYFQPNRKIIKKSSPYDDPITGERLKINFETGEVRNYKKQEVLYSKACSVRRTKIALKMLLEMNEFDWFCTLTFDKERIDRTDDKAVYECYRKYIDNTQHLYPTLRYICVPERHAVKDDEDFGCIHFHLLIGGVPASALGLVNSGKVCCSWATKLRHGKRIPTGICSKEYFDKTKNEHELRDTDGEPIYNITSFAYGLTTASRIVSPERCKSYVAKYIDKSIGCSTEVFKKRFYYSRNLKVPEVVKNLIDKDFEYPTDINKLQFVVNDELVKNATYTPKINNYNVMQFKIDNMTKNFIRQNVIPSSEDLVFENYQENFNLDDELDF